MSVEKLKPLSKQIEKLASRLDRLEAQLRTGQRRPESTQENASERFCSLPEVPERTFERDVSLHRARLIRYLDKKWVNGTKLRYYFFKSGPFSGEDTQKALVREGFDVWKAVGIGIGFEEVADIGESEVRIGFLSGDGAWSYVGRDVIDIPGQSERTMNFGWDLTQDPRGVDTPVHEIGHTLGFPHEHQNPFAGIIWDEEAVYNYFGGPPNNWSRETTHHNVLKKLLPGAVEGSEWDPDSIMHYKFQAGLIEKPEEYQEGLTPQPGLSDSDIEEVRRLYPPQDDSSNPTLEPFKSEVLSLAPGEQKNFAVVPGVTREYTIQTFGASDTVMVLFEDQGGNLKFVDGDDDSGSHLNARIRARLYQGRRYILRIRLYFNFSAGDMAIMMW
ncbi:regulatory protein [Nitrococcus mobilis Nb-231]|uniref:Regulatory protein n=2 Tax=Nitrococcus mobilis TaxID=35797 RepID=A4BQP7_9GAMM|nr:regulatory protein [Nitrococcus mobilis Nb-231]